MEGIYRDRFGLAATVKHGRIQREKRWPLGTPLDTLRRWRIQARADLAAERQSGKPVTGTLRADGDRFLERRKATTAYKADRAHLRAWYPTLGDQLRSAITPDAVRALIATWLGEHVAARTVRHRMRVLKQCYHVLDGPKAPTPLDDIKAPTPPASRPIAVPIATITTVAENLKTAGELKEYARFVVRATTGQRPVQVMRATPDDID
jgi:hypothetical protein